MGHSKFMSKSKPKTIADLKINWTFEPKQQPIMTTMDSIVRLNPKLKRLRIKNGYYTFEYSEINIDLNVKFSVHDGDERLKMFSGFLEELDYLIRGRRQFHQGLYLKPLTLDKFELLSENTFRIHVKK